MCASCPAEPPKLWTVEWFARQWNMTIPALAGMGSHSLLLVPSTDCVCLQCWWTRFIHVPPVLCFICFGNSLTPGHGGTPLRGWPLA